MEGTMMNIHITKPRIWMKRIARSIVNLQILNVSLESRTYRLTVKHIG